MGEEVEEEEVDGVAVLPQQRLHRQASEDAPHDMLLWEGCRGFEGRIEN